VLLDIAVSLRDRQARRLGGVRRSHGAQRHYDFGALISVDFKFFPAINTTLGRGRKRAAPHRINAKSHYTVPSRARPLYDRNPLPRHKQPKPNPRLGCDFREPKPARPHPRQSAHVRGPVSFTAPNTHPIAVTRGDRAHPPETRTRTIRSCRVRPSAVAAYLPRTT
jgi:hypothetical protein